MNVNLIVAVDAKCFGIGKNGTIPWKNKDDMKWFKSVTTGDGNNAVVMGRRTYESIGKPLPNRLNIVLTRSETNIPGCIVVSSLEESIKVAQDKKIDSLFVIGGGKVYEEALLKDLIDVMYINYIDSGIAEDGFDTFFKLNHELDWKFSKTITSYNLNKSANIDIQIYVRNRAENNNVDEPYLNLIKKILTDGQTKQTRAGETLSIFGEALSFDMREGLPILTTKKVYSKGCIHELLWFLQGNTNIKYLMDNNTHIWDDDAYRYYIHTFNDNITKQEFLYNVLDQKTKEYINNSGEKSTYTFGDLGPIYGKQWTNWNGINQIDDLIYKLKTNPHDRRLMISAWNVGELNNMALPPCHYLSQWYVTDMTPDERVNEYLRIIGETTKYNITQEYLDSINFPKQFISLMWMQRSVDTCLGLPYDLLSYSIFLSLIAQCVNMIPLHVKCCLGDTHIYKNQIQGAYKQISRNPYKYNLPKLVLNKNIKNIYDFTIDDIKIENYNSYSAIKYPLSVGL